MEKKAKEEKAKQWKLPSQFKSLDFRNVMSWAVGSVIWARNSHTNQNRVSRPFILMRGKCRFLLLRTSNLIPSSRITPAEI